MGKLSAQDLADMQVFMDSYQGNPTQLTPAQCLCLMERIVRVERLLKESMDAGKKMHEAMMYGVQFSKKLMRITEETTQLLDMANRRIKELEANGETGKQASEPVQDSGRPDTIQLSEVEGPETPAVPEGPDGGGIQKAGLPEV